MAVQWPFEHLMISLQSAHMLVAWTLDNGLSRMIRKKANECLVQGTRGVPLILGHGGVSRLDGSQSRGRLCGDLQNSHVR